MKGEIRCRAAGRADLPRVREIDAEVFGVDTYPALFFRQAWDLWPGLFLVSETGAEDVCGYGLGAVGLDGSGWILSVAVRPAARGRGAGRTLTSELISAFAALGVRAVRLTVHPSSSAVRLYRQLGFVPAYEEEDYFSPGDPRLVMHLDRVDDPRS